jgi:chorismate mutase
MIAIRGATTIQNDTKDEVLNATKILINEVINRNKLKIDEIISIIFTCTHDIKSAYPAQAARELNIVHAGLICVNEMEVTGSMSKCIRLLMYANLDSAQKSVNHVYLGDTVKLRPDLVNK